MAEDRDPPAVPVGAGTPRLVRPLLLYNGGCQFCRWMARIIDRLDRDDALAYLSIWDDDARPFMEVIPMPERVAVWHLVMPDGSQRSGGPAVVDVLERLGWTGWFGRLCRALRLTRLLDAGYDFVSKRKSRLSHHVPDGPGPHRFP
jgi:predicted DCC family thiol-disulfide oxidoreductase YuxK